ncbi:MAG: T9SS type A sorting domain-containing protein [bacterium]
MNKRIRLHTIIWLVTILLLIVGKPSWEQESRRIESSNSLTNLLNEKPLNLKTNYIEKRYDKALKISSITPRPISSDWSSARFVNTASLSLMSHPDDVFWDDRFDQLGVNGAVLAIAVSGSDLYVGGSFSMVGDVNANNIAKWDGSNWTPLGSGANNGTNGNVLAIAVSGSDLYVGGSFSMVGDVNANNIAKWDGSNWSAMGSGTGGDVKAIYVSSNEVYVGGVFTAAGGGSANNIALWNGSSWSALGSGVNNGVNAPVSAIAGKDNLVYLGGSFTTAGGDSVKKIVCWNSSSNTWSPLGSGVNLDVDAIIVNGNDVYAGGLFTIAGSVSAKNIAKWDGNNWSALGDGMSGGGVSAMAIIGSELYVGGSFVTAGNVSANKIAKWDGSNWSALGSGIEGGLVFSIATSLNDVYVGGSFNTAGGKPSANFARWNDQDGTVPIELISFTAKLRGSLVELLWTTASETNNFGFEVERMVIDTTKFLSKNNSASQSNNQWEKIAFVQGHGTTANPHNYSYTDNVQSLISMTSRTLKYRLKQIDLDGRFEYFEPVEVMVGKIPTNIILGQNYPNPFNPETTIEFVIPNDASTTLKVYNMLGQEVQTLINENLRAGVIYKVNFNGSSLPSGIYFYVLRSGNPVKAERRRMLLLK